MIVRFVARIRGRDRWWCKCDCGGEKEVRQLELATKKTRSCGCLVFEASRKNIAKACDAIRLPDRREQTLKQWFAKHRRSGTIGGHGFLEFALWKAIVTQPCFYCKITGRRVATRSTRTRGYHEIAEPVEMVGVDRLDSAIGYVESNCVPCCSQCNRMKNATPLPQFLEKIRAIYLIHFGADAG